MSLSEPELKMSTTSTSEAINQTEFDNVSLHSSSDSISSDGSYDFADENFPCRSVNSPFNISEAEDTEIQIDQELENLNDDVELSKLRSDLQNHWEEMLRLFDDAPNPAIINKQLRDCSRSIAAMFGDDISALEDRIQAHGEEYEDLHALLVLEKNSAYNEKCGLKDHLLQTMINHEAEFKKKEVQVRMLDVEMTDALDRESLQESRAIVERAKLLEENEVAIENTTAKYEALISEKDRQRKAYTDTVAEAHQKYDQYIAELKTQHEKEMQKQRDKLLPEVRMAVGFQKDISELSKKLEQKDARIEELSSLSKCYESTISQQNDEIIRLTAMVGRFKQEIKEQYLTAIEQKQRETRNDEERMALFTENRKLAQTVTLAQSTVKEQSQEIANLEPTASQKCVSELDESLNTKLKLHESYARALEKEAETARETISSLESSLDETADENYWLQVRIEDLELQYNTLEKDKEDEHNDTMGFINQLSEVKTHLDIVTEVINDYVDSDMHGPDSQEQWDSLLDEIDRIIKEPHKLLDELRFKSNQPKEMEVDDDGEKIVDAEAILDEQVETNNDLTSCAEDLVADGDIATNTAIDLWETINPLLTDIGKMNVATAKAMEERDMAIYKRRSTEARYKDLEQRLANAETQSAIENAELQAKIHMANEYLEQHLKTKDLEEENAWLKEWIEVVMSISEELVTGVEILIKEQKDVNHGTNELQMAVFYADQRASFAEDELRGIGNDIEWYRQEKGIIADVDMIDKVTGKGARKALNTVFRILSVDGKHMKFQWLAREEAENNLEEIEKHVDDENFLSWFD